MALKSDNFNLIFRSPPDAQIQRTRRHGYNGIRHFGSRGKPGETSEKLRQIPTPQSPNYCENERCG